MGGKGSGAYQTNESFMRWAPREVFISGIAVMSALGCTVNDFWAGLVSGAIGTRQITRFDTSNYRTGNGGEVAGFDADLMLPDSAFKVLPRSNQYAVAVVGAAMRDAGLAEAHDTGICLGTVMGTRPHLERLLESGLSLSGDRSWVSSSSLAEIPAQAYGLNGPTNVVASGCSAGNDAIGLGYHLVAFRHVDRVIAGGVEELSEAVYALFTNLRALAPDNLRPFDVDRLGILPAEGAAALVLESAESVQNRGVRTYGQLLGYGCRADAYHVTAPEPTGRAVVGSIRDALDQAGLSPQDIGYVNAHGTGTPASDAIEAEALGRLFGSAGQTCVSSIKGSIGHAQGAASALETVASLLAISRGQIPGMPTLRQADPRCTAVDLVCETRSASTRAAVNVAFGFGGSASALVLGATS